METHRITFLLQVNATIQRFLPSSVQRECSLKTKQKEKQYSFALGEFRTENRY